MKILNLTPVLIAVILVSCNAEEKMERLNHHLLEADRAFSRLSQEQGANRAFEVFAAHGAVLLRPGHMPIEERKLWRRSTGTGMTRHLN